MPNEPKQAVLYARITIVGTVFFFSVMYIAFVFIQPELNPIHRFGSEYSVGRMGWLMKLAFFVWSAGLMSFALAMAKGLDSKSRSYAAIVLFAVGALSIFLAGVFDSDLQVLNSSPPPRWIEGPSSYDHILHTVASMVGLLSLMIGIGITSRRLRLSGRLQSGYRVLRSLSWSAPVAFVAMATLFASYGLVGLGQRIFLALMFAWLLIAAHGLSVGAFSSHR